MTLINRKASNAAARLRVLHLLPQGRALGGTERTVLDLLSAPALAHAEQRVIFVQPGGIQEFPRTMLLGGPAGRMFPGAALPAALLWRPHVLHGWLLQGNLLGALLKPALPSATLISSERNLGHNLNTFKRRLEGFVARFEDVATGNSFAVRDAAIARAPRRAPRFRVIPPGVAAPALTSEIRPTTAVMVGRLHPAKDHETALRAWRRVVARRPTEILTIVGSGPERQPLERTARELQLGSAVRFRGEADPAPDLYGARIFLSTSRAEGFSRALLEALAVGVPAVSTNVGGVSEVEGEAVRIAPTGDDAAVAAHVLGWLEDADSLRHAATAARVAAERFSPARCHEAYARLYEEVCEIHDLAGSRDHPA